MPELDLFDELRKLIGLLDEHEINYALCGGSKIAGEEARKTEVKNAAGTPSKSHKRETK